MIQPTDRHIHFHIQWRRKDLPDWEGFDTRREAIARALELAAPGERFSIKEATEDCAVCAPKAVLTN